MSLVSLDDQFFGHPKAKRAGEEAADLFVRGLAYCRRYKTGGDIPKAALDECSKHKQAPSRAAALVRETLWIDCGDHWHVHEYEHWYSNDAETKLESQRKLAAARAKRYRAANKTDTPPITPPSRDGKRDGSHDGKRDGDVTSPLARTRAHGDPNSDSYSDGSKRENPLPPSNEELNQSAMQGPRGDEIAALLNQTSEGRVDLMASSDVLVELADIARSVNPKPLTMIDFGLLGEAIAAKKAMAWYESKRITLSYLTKDRGKHLLDAMVEARAWADELRRNHG